MFAKTHNEKHSLCVQILSKEKYKDPTLRGC